jgi:hypothetical protein
MTQRDLDILLAAGILSKERNPRIMKALQKIINHDKQLVLTCPDQKEDTSK